MRIKNTILTGLVLVLAVSGCAPSMNRVSNNAYSDSAVNKHIAVTVDLDKVLKATGQDGVIKKQMEILNADLIVQISDIVSGFNKQLAEKKKKFGADITVDEQQKLQEMLIKANQLLSQKQTEATVKKEQHKQRLMNAWRKKIQPLVKSVAEKKGAKVVLIQGAAVMWSDAVIDITDEVITSLRDKSAENNKKVNMPLGSGDII